MEHLNYHKSLELVARGIIIPTQSCYKLIGSKPVLVRNEQPDAHTIPAPTAHEILLVVRNACMAHHLCVDYTRGSISYIENASGKHKFGWPITEAIADTAYNVLLFIKSAQYEKR